MKECLDTRRLAEKDVLREDNARLKAMVEGLAARVAAQSELLTRNAKKGGADGRLIDSLTAELNAVREEQWGWVFWCLASWAGTLAGAAVWAGLTLAGR